MSRAVSHSLLELVVSSFVVGGVFFSSTRLQLIQRLVKPTIFLGGRELDSAPLLRSD